MLGVRIRGAVMSYHDRPAPGDGGDYLHEEYDPDGPGTTEPRDTLEMPTDAEDCDDCDDCDDLRSLSGVACALEAAWAESDRLRAEARAYSAEADRWSKIAQDKYRAHVHARVHASMIGPHPTGEPV